MRDRVEMFNYTKDFIKIVEVGPRDGLQNEKIIVSMEDKVEYIQKLMSAGFKTIEATSFVREDKIPQMAHAAELFTRLKEISDFHLYHFPCLVPNQKGYEKALKAGVEEISLFSATSDEFTKKNINCTVKESFERMSEVAQEAKKDGLKIRGYISTAFGCPYSGEIGIDKLEEVAQEFLKLGVYEISIGDTIGVATPKQVYHYLFDLKKGIDIKKMAMHFHDTRGMAIANVLTSLELGIQSFDSSSGGLGGCPYALGATGNVATEELVYLFESLGLDTGVDLEKLIEASSFILEKVKKKTPSKYLQTLI